MGNILVAYGGDRRKGVLEVAVERAAAGGHELYVLHVQGEPGDSSTGIRDEIEAIVQQTDPYIVYDIDIDRADEGGGSTQDRLIGAIDARAYEYVVMGAVNRGSIEDFTHSSMTEAVLEERVIPVLLVPV